MQRRTAVAPAAAAATASGGDAGRCIIGTGTVRVGLKADDTDNDDGGDGYAGGNAYDLEFLRTRTVRRAADAGAAAAAAAAAEMAGSAYARHRAKAAATGKRPIPSSSVAPRHSPAGVAGRTSPLQPAD